jgi:hypothetical protein
MTSKASTTYAAAATGGGGQRATVSEFRLDELAPIALGVKHFQTSGSLRAGRFFYPCP